MSLATPAITNFTAGEISPRLEGRTDLSKYYNGCRILENFHVHPHGGATRRSGFRFVAETLNPSKPVLLIPFEFSASETYVLEFGEDDQGQGRMRVFSGHGVVLSGGEEYVRDIPYTSTEFDRIRHAQSANTLILVHPDHPPREMLRVDHDNWTLKEMAFIGQPENWKANNYPSAVGFYEQRLVLAGTPDSPATIWMSRTGAFADFRLKTREVPIDGWRDREIKDGNADSIRDGKAGDTVVLLNGDGFEAKDGLKGQHPDGTTRYYRYKGAKNYSASGTNLTITFADDPADKQIESIWDDRGVLNEEYWDCFETGDRTDAPAGEEPLDDDGLEVTLSGRQANGIEFIVSRSSLWIGTAGGEWTLAASSSEPLSPGNVKANHEGTCGASSTRPESVGFATLYIQRAGRKIREMSYRYESDAYVSRDLTLLSEHITEGGLTRLAYVQEPDSILYGVRSDGVLVALTYVPDQEVAAWSRIITDGAVEEVTSIYNDAKKRDELWIVVARAVNGEQRRYIEYLEGDFDGRIENAFYVDSGLTYAGDPTDIVQGLDHLTGRTVSVLADGAVQRDKVVGQDGTLVLDRPASIIHAGLAYASRLQPMRLDAGSQRGTSQTKKKRIIKVAARFYQTLGGRIGPDAANLEPVYSRSPATPMGQSPGAFDGDKIVNFPKGWGRDGLLTIVQDQPLPMSVLLIVPHLAVNE
ncbi:MULTISPECIES: hypothetical protein [unclassified Pseudodesulfovibrio]|uniref:hypothetical protein n=1 Tax=unclassified Pseudodesulfovibrio TaxID=2661612 RepID=UPI000FEBB072|nr:MULTISPECIES: hypothetical protein [unclassified Pseudodesulfovibrio]MCJ2165539.1 hypothetical protein [Pseudodesulfovibrio sp. S3-i]RWU03100.1 hypothetical protein DWB63_12910 [Pseudodesulfovibrio sp. S3]